MNLKNYVKDHGIFLLIQLTAIAVLEGVLLLFHAAFALQMFFLFVELLALFGVLFYDYGRKRQFYAHMEGQMETLKEEVSSDGNAGGAGVFGRKDFLSGHAGNGKIHE